ncbi:MAG: GNAT family N-acetyltransferase, partial [Dehalococcoidia bacterium]|nr:GNAT family N-acetyltransferase [Dehalococcoidia bacterium]
IGGESRNLIALVKPGRCEDVASALALHLTSGLLSRRRILRLALVPSNCHLLTALVAAVMKVRNSAQISIRPHSYAPFVPLPAVWEDFWGTLGKRRRKLLLRNQRHLDLARRDVTLRQSQGDNVAASMVRLFDLHDQRWREGGVRGLFHDARNRSFHLEMARHCDQMGMLDLSELLIDGETASVYFTCVLDGVAYMMRSGRDTAFAEDDVGHLHDLRLFRKWIAEGRHEADLLRGAEPYKFYWASRFRVYTEFMVAPPWSKGALPLWFARRWMILARALSHRHPPGEFLAYLRMRRAARRELRKMGIELQPK